MSSFKKRLLAFFILLVIAFFALVLRNNMLLPIKIILESGFLSLIMWAYSIASGVIYSVVTDRKISDLMDFFKKYANMIYTIATFGIGGSTSLTLIKGVFLQYFYKTEFFIGFTSIDIASMALLSSVLLVYCVLGCTTQLIEALSYSSATETSTVEEAYNNTLNSDRATAARS